MSTQRNGTLNLLLSVTTLVSLLISAYYVGVKMGAMEEQLRNQTLLLTAITNRLYEHELSEGHGPMVKRVDALETRMASIETRAIKSENRRR